MNLSFVEAFYWVATLKSEAIVESAVAFAASGASSPALHRKKR